MARTPKEDVEAKSIADKLSEAQVRALLAIAKKHPFDGRSKAPLLFAGLIELTEKGGVRITPLGRRVVRLY